MQLLQYCALIDIVLSSVCSPRIAFGIEIFVNLTRFISASLKVF